MPETPLTDAIVALTTYANTVTGASDTTLSDAVDTLTSGYGTGASLEFLKTVTLSEGVNNLILDVSDLTSEYNMIIIQGTMNFSTADWFYPNYWTGETRHTMGGYTEKVASYAATWGIISIPGSQRVVVAPPHAGYIVSDIVTGIGGHCYNGSTTVVAGSAFNYYGLKYTL